MRIGFNPLKDKELPPNDFFHQVIVPVYIPNQEGYFKDSFTIFKYCLASLFKTCHSKTYFTVVNNGCCQEVIDYLNDLHNQGEIHELIHTTAIGKLNAVLKGLSGQNFQIVTITDADVLFLNDWQKSTYAVFEAFPKAGAVCPTPSSKTIRQNTSNVLIENLFSKEMKFTPVINQKALQAFAISIGNPDFYNKYQLDNYLTVANGTVKAVVGAGHFVTSYRGTVFNTLKERYSNFSLGGNSEIELLDKPVSEKGFWRLSTEDNYAYHMGNTLEPWMEEAFANCKTLTEEGAFPLKLAKVKTNSLLIWFQQLFFAKVLVRKPIWKWFLHFKGLSKEAASGY